MNNVTRSKAKQVRIDSLFMRSGKLSKPDKSESDDQNNKGMSSEVLNDENALKSCKSVNKILVENDEKACQGKNILPDRNILPEMPRTENLCQEVPNMANEYNNFCCNEKKNINPEGLQILQRKNCHCMTDLGQDLSIGCNIGKKHSFGKIPRIIITSPNGFQLNTDMKNYCGKHEYQLSLLDKIPPGASNLVENSRPEFQQGLITETQPQGNVLVEYENLVECRPKTQLSLSPGAETCAGNLLTKTQLKKKVKVLVENWIESGPESQQSLLFKAEHHERDLVELTGGLRLINESNNKQASTQPSGNLDMLTETQLERKVLVENLIEGGPGPQLSLSSRAQAHDQNYEIFC